MPGSILKEVGRLFGGAVPRTTPTRLICPSCGSALVAQVLGDNGGISYVCTACGHSWS